MRVIAGTYKGRKLESPDNYDIRPTTDKAKEAMFSILANQMWGARVLDVFAGTGALGIEALSRGADSCLFVDHSRQSASLIRRNLEACGIGKEGRVVTGDYRRVLSSLEGPYDIILMDPPYNKGLLDDAFALLRQQDLLAEEGIIVCEHRKEEEIPEEIHGFTREKERRYGIVKLSIYR